MRHHTDHDPHELPSYTRRRLLVVGVVSAAPLLAWAQSQRRRSAATSPSTSMPPGSSASAPPSSLSVSQASSTVAGGAPVSAPAPTPVVWDHDIRHGMSETKVQRVQERLTQLRFDPGPTDGVFGDATLRAVWAFEKLVAGVPRQSMSGVVTAELWARMNEPLTAAARRTPGGTHVEVYLPEQVAIVFINGAPRVITHVSTGEGVEWCDEVDVDNDDGTTATKGICGRSITPGGVYHFERKVDGWRNAALGRLYKPVYFNYGIAIHGASNVPDEPKSRGCVRIPMHIAEYFPELVAIGDTVFVFDGVDTPEHYGAQLPVFDWPDPNSTTTTTVPTTAGAQARNEPEPAPPSTLDI